MFGEQAFEEIAGRFTRTQGGPGLAPPSNRQQRQSNEVDRRDHGLPRPTSARAFRKEKGEKEKGRTAASTLRSPTFSSDYTTSRMVRKLSFVTTTGQS
jgi:hypothetical protein